MVLVPNWTSLGNVNSGACVVLSIRLFQYWKPRRELVDQSWSQTGVQSQVGNLQVVLREVSFRQVKVPLLWSFRLLLAWVVTEKYAECLLLKM